MLVETMRFCGYLLHCCEWKRITQLVWYDPQIDHVITHTFQRCLKRRPVRIPNSGVALSVTKVSQFVSSAEYGDYRLWIDPDL